MAVTFIAFLEGKRIAWGALAPVLTALKARFDNDPGEPVLVFEAETGRQTDFDLRGSLDEVLARAAAREAGPTQRPGPGRPKLGVVSREISLLPRHWSWLEAQPHGISATLRRLVDEARKKAPEEEQLRIAIERAARFMTAVAGDRENFEEATRALYKKDHASFDALTSDWPADIRAYVQTLLSTTPPENPS